MLHTVTVSQGKFHISVAGVFIYWWMSKTTEFCETPKPYCEFKKGLQVHKENQLLVQVNSKSVWLQSQPFMTIYIISYISYIS